LKGRALSWWQKLYADWEDVTSSSRATGKAWLL